MCVCIYIYIYIIYGNAGPACSGARSVWSE